MRDYRSLAEWSARRADLQKQVLAAAGLLPMPEKTPLNVQVIRKHDAPGYSVETVMLETFPGFRLGGNLYKPSKLESRAPAILVPHGHWKQGRVTDLPEYSVPKLCINLAMRGYVVFAYDMVGYNDTTAMSHSFTGKDEALWSFHPLAVQTWNAIRVVDYLQSLPEVDPEQIGMAGASGGGTQTFLLSAIDSRIKYAAPINMISAHMQGGDPCEEAPNLHIGTFNVELAAMTAPRPMLIISSTRDWTKNTPREEFPSIQKIYRLYGAKDRVSNLHLDEPHGCGVKCREALYNFFDKQRRGGRSNNLKDQTVEVPPDDVLLAPERERQPQNDQGVFEAWKRASRPAKSITPDERREAVRYVTGARWPQSVAASKLDDKLLLTYADAAVLARWTEGKGRPIVVIGPQIETDRPVLAIDPFTSSEQRNNKSQFDKNFLSYNRSDDAHQLQDILIALSYAKSRTGIDPELFASKESGVISYLATLLAPFPISSKLPEDLTGDAFMPGIRRALGRDD